MIVTEKDIEKKMLICYACDNPLEIGQSYEMITTHSKTEITVHTDCIKKRCE